MCIKMNPIAQITRGQDGAIFGGYLFRFSARGECRVFSLDTVKQGGEVEVEPVAVFPLDRADALAPHSNAVSFGREYAVEGDEFPLLYTNIYNNYAKAENPLKGVCCVYRLQRQGTVFSSTLVQLIEIGFTEDTGLWRSSAAGDDVRPYGNFTVDAENGIYYAFVMRDGSQRTRYFAFDLPRAGEGVEDETFHVKKVTLTAGDIRDWFDCEYHRYLQGACVHRGRIYSVEGFTNSVENPAALRVIDPAAKQQVLYANLAEMGFPVEPEWIDFADDVCYYSDAHGKLYVLEF